MNHAVGAVIHTYAWWVIFRGMLIYITFMDDLAVTEISTHKIQYLYSYLSIKTREVAKHHGISIALKHIIASYPGWVRG